MKILFLSQRFLLPMDTGGKIRTGKILEQLAKRHDITLVSNVESPKDDRYLPAISAHCHRFVPVPWREVPKHSARFLLRLFFQMFSPYPVSVLNDTSRRLETAVLDQLAGDHYDLAICDFVQSALMFRRVTDKLPTLLFQHNVESVIARRHVDRATNPLIRLFWWLQWKKMAAFEKKACASFDTVIAVSEKDRDLFRELYGITNAVTIPTGVDIDYFTPPAQAIERPHSLVFCGSMDWLPNEDAILFFLRDILPQVQHHFPDVTLTVVGRNPSPALQSVVNEYPQVRLTDWVEDTRPYIAESSLYIVPIRIGGGTRMKIFEAMAMSKAILSTPIGAEGLPVTNGDNIVLACEAADLARRIVELLADDARRQSLGATARRFVAKHFAWPSVADVFEHICRDTADSRRG